MNDKVKLTIGMPIFNGGKNLVSALDSLLNQTFKDFILIISDNASTDATEEICRRYQQKDPRIKYYRNKKNIGATNNFQKVLDLAESQYFMWAAHDDLWEPSFVSDLLEILEKDKESVLAFCNYDFISGDDDSKRFKAKSLPYFYFSKVKDLYNRLKILIHQNLAMFIYGIYRTNILKQIGGFPNRSEGGFGDDNLLLLKLTFHGSFHFHSKLLFHKREREYSSKLSLVKKIKSIFSTFINYMIKQIKFQNYQRKIIIKGKINIFNKIFLILNTYIAQIFNYLIILISNFIPLKFKIQEKLIKNVIKIFQRDKLFLNK
ncbi:MAG: glycosyltransferase family 2 protein [Candidatus Helarchaeota archaeon]